KRSANKPKARVSSESSKSNRKNKPASGEERTEITLTGNHEVLVSDNRIKYIIAREGDTRESIAREIDLNVFILNRFNDFDRAMELKPGDIVYLQPKRNQTRNAEYVATEGDSWFSISQKNGIKLKRLCKLNSTTPDKPVATGTRIILKK
ncbi:MAG: LysM peptidoglycan-binding domain-containing protein, partial [Flavobacteriales bacterium]